MIMSLPNPIKSFQIEMPISHVAKSVQHLVLYTDKYKITKSNPLINQYTFEAYEFLSLGVYIDINCFVINENRTDVKIEIRRKVGTFNQAHEVQNANKHLEQIVSLITKSISTDPTARLAEIKHQNEIALAKKKAINESVNEYRKKHPMAYQLKILSFYTLWIGIILGCLYFIFWVIRKF